MANISLYVSGQTDQADISEFFQKGLMSAGENPIAFFDGVFYESHQERVGNIAFQDYLIYTDKAVYLWARGSTKDFLDRFDLGTVSVNSRNKDHDFATLNLKIRREEKDPVYVIFDMVELREADQILKLHTVIESIIEERLGLNFRSNLPDEVADAVLRGARGVCTPQIITLRLAAPDPAQQESHIGYGQDLLEQYKANMGYPPSEHAQQPPMHSSGASHGGEHGAGGFSPADALKGLENILPTDPASLKKVVDSLKGIVGDAPFKLRDQVRSDLQHVPGMISALTELLTSISDNPQAERFIMNIVKTAVRNDGMIGSVSKLMKLSSSFGGSPKKNSPKSTSNSGSARDSSRSDRRDPFDDDDFGTQRKKINISSDDDATRNDDCFGREPLPGKVTTVSSASSIKSARSFADLDDDDDTPRRKSISITTLDESQPAIVKHMLHSDDSSWQKSAPESALPKVSVENGAGTARKKIMIVQEEEKVLEPAEHSGEENLPDPDDIAAAFAAIRLEGGGDEEKKLSGQ
ncbi:MAG: hypothetical protein HGB23_00280 [Chlorobiaceae bacterium]|nr:hypothetical protein [Chlorobiaceae bacterium]